MGGCNQRIGDIDFLPVDEDLSFIFLVVAVEIFMSVDLPAPFSPTRASTSPSATEKPTSSSALTPGNDLLI